MKWPQQSSATRIIGPISKNKPLSSKKFLQIQFITFSQIEIKLNCPWAGTWLPHHGGIIAQGPSGSPGNAPRSLPSLPYPLKLLTSALSRIHYQVLLCCATTRNLYVCPCVCMWQCTLVQMCLRSLMPGCLCVCFGRFEHIWYLHTSTWPQLFFLASFIFFVLPSCLSWLLIQPNNIMLILCARPLVFSTCIMCK